MADEIKFDEIDWIDHRRIDDVSFGEETGKVRSILKRCGIGIVGVEASTRGPAQGIYALGCTGLAVHDIPLDDAILVRRNMGGSRAILPCFVTSDRYCLVHDTIGGLSPGAPGFHTDAADKISRDLTTAERGKTMLMQEAIRAPGRSTDEKLRAAADKLVGIDADIVEDENDNLPFPQPVMSTAPQVINVPAPIEPWMCPEHTRTVWRCRFCVAAAIAAGELVPSFMYDVGDDEIVRIMPDDIDTQVRHVDQSGSNSFDLYALVARWTRRLARL